MVTQTQRARLEQTRKLDASGKLILLKTVFPVTMNVNARAD
jgi:hypothetical protein